MGLGAMLSARSCVAGIFESIPFRDTGITREPHQTPPFPYFILDNSRPSLQLPPRVDPQEVFLASRLSSAGTCVLDAPSFSVYLLVG